MRQRDSIRVLVRLSDAAGLGKAEREAASPDECTARMASLQDALLRELEGTETRVVRRFSRRPLIALEVDEATLRRLRECPLVESVRRDRASPADAGP